VLLGDLDLAVVATLDHRRVVGVDEAGFGVQVVHRLVVGLGVGDVRVDPDVCNERVDCHGLLSSPGDGRS